MGEIFRKAETTVAVEDDQISIHRIEVDVGYPPRR